MKNQIPTDVSQSIEVREEIESYSGLLERLEERNQTVDDVIESLKVTQFEFCPEKTLLEIFEQENEYYLQHGMSAFDCGYCGKELSTSNN